MRGIGDNIVIPLGSACIDIEIQNIIEKVNVFIDLDFLGFHVSDEGIDHVIDVLRVDVKDWISTVQSDDEEIKRIREILWDDDTKFIADVRNNYQLRGEHVYQTNDYVNGDDLMQLRSKAKEKIDEQQIKAKKDFDKHRKKGTDYNIGDLVRIERNLVD
ncbi:hypothetical protein ACJJTC_006377 [Scirpophaga incertulas]